MRIMRHCLEPGDQVSVCDTVLVYREDPAVLPADSRQHGLLRACSLLFLFRALAMSTGGHRAAIGGHIVRLIADMVPWPGGARRLGRDADEVGAAAGELAVTGPLGELIGRVWR